MKTWSIVLAVMIAFMLSLTVANAAAPSAPAAPAKPIRGTISKVDGASITVKARDGTETTFTTNADTVVTIAGEKKTVADLAVGKRANVTLDADGKVATAITSGRPAAPATATAPAANP